MTLMNSVWLNRLGLISGFVSFWLAAPELIGEGPLKAADRLIRKALSKVFDALIFIVVIFIVVLVLGSGLIGYVFEILHFFRGTSLVQLFWLWYGIIIGGIVGSFILAVLVDFPIRLFANEGAYRRRALIFGAGFFGLSWIFQFAATFAPSS
jgi:formate/nitrite transporter FocA (FNT family)